MTAPTNDWAEKNRAHFNEAASTYNTKFGKTILQLITEIQNRRDWISPDLLPSPSSSDDEYDEDEDSTTPSAACVRRPVGRNERSVRLLDYACGTGLVSRALAPYITQSLGIDISSAMVSEYNTGALNQGIPESEMRAVVGNLIGPTPDPEFEIKEFYNFDIAAVGMGFHHFPDPGLAAKRLGERLKKGGVLLILDFLPHENEDGDGSEHGHSHGHSHGGGEGHDHGKGKEVDVKAEMEKRGVTHMGFSEADVKAMFENASVGGDFEYVVLGKGVVFSKEGVDMRREVFMARGRKV